MKDKQKDGVDMNSTQMRALMQYAATAAASYIAGKGWMSGDQAYGLMIWIAAGIPVIVGIWQERDAGKLTDAANVKDETGAPVTIVAPDKIANSIPKDNVVSSSVHQVTPK